MSESAATEFLVTHQVSPDEVVLVIAGDLDVSTASDVDSALAGLRPLARRLAIDVSGVTFIDSSGLRSLLSARRASLDDTDSPARLVGAGDRVVRLLELTGLAGTFADD